MSYYFILNFAAEIIINCIIFLWLTSYLHILQIFMKLIKLTKNQFAMVDDEDFEKLNAYKWQAWRPPYKTIERFYALRPEMKNSVMKRIYMHRQIMGVENSDGWEFVVDHIDGNPLNNQKSNLRIITRSENSKHRTAKSAFRVNKLCAKNIVIFKDGYQVYIYFEGKKINIGRFSKFSDAAKAYNDAAKLYHGESAELNDESNSMNHPDLTGGRLVNKLGVKGVYFFKNRYQAYIYYNGKQLHLGRHKTLDEAKKARMDAEIKYGVNK